MRTCLTSAKVKFTVLIESAAGSQKTWEVALWHNFDASDQWTSSSLKPSAEPSVVWPLAPMYTYQES